MAAYDGALARQLELGEQEGWAKPRRTAGSGALRLAPGGARLRGPDKYKVLEHRRRQAQMAARRLLDLEG